MGSEIVGANENTLTVGDTEYDLTKGLWAFIMLKPPQVSQWPSRDYRTHKSLSAQTKVKSHPNPRGSTRRRATWKYKHMLKRMYLYLGKVYQRKKKKILKAQTLIRWEMVTYFQLILVYCHQVCHHLFILDLMGKLKRLGIEEHFIKLTKVKE